MHTPEEIAQSISDGHAFDFHVLGTPREISNGQLSANSNQFDHDTEKYGSRLGITTREQFRNHIFETLHDPNTIGYRRANGGAVLFNESTNTHIFYDPTHPELGTALRSEYGVEWFVKNYDKDVRNFRAEPNPRSAFINGGLSSIIESEPPRIPTADPEQSVGDRRTEARQKLNELGITTLTPDGNPLRKPLINEHHASRAVGAVSLGVDLAQGNYGAAAVDAAAMAAENKAVQEAAVETATKVGGSGLVKAFAACAKRAPVIGAAVTLAFVAKEAGAHMLDGEYKLAGAATVAGLAEAGGNVLGFGMGDAAREAARGAMIAAGGDEFAAVEKSGIRELGEAAYDVGKQMLAAPSPAQKPPEGRVLTDILPADMRSMMQGADEMGDRSEIRHVAVERTGLAANDPRNDIGAINQNPEGPKAHLLILADGRVQGPDEGGVPFDRNPSIAAGKNGETIGVMYAGQGAMNDAQWSTVRQISDYVEQQRRLEGRGGKPELMAGTTATADMLGLPTPRGSQLAQTTQTPAFHQRQSHGFG